MRMVLSNRYFDHLFEREIYYKKNRDTLCRGFRCIM